MGVFKRGKNYWYEFEFRGQRVRESAHTPNRELAGSIERNRRRAMEESAGGIKRAKPILFRKAAVAYFDECAHWSDAYREINTLKLSHLLPAFGKLLLTDITPASIARYQRDRRLAGASGCEINMETAVLRMILRKHRLRHLLAPDFRPLPEREDIGRALSLEEANRLLEAAAKCPSRSLAQNTKYCFPSCGRRATAVAATRDSPEKAHDVKLERAARLAQEWTTARTNLGWKQWVHRRESDISPNFLTRAVNEKKLTVPVRQ